MHLPLVNNFMGSRVPQFKVTFKNFFSPPSARELRQSQNHVESIKTSMKSQCVEKAKTFVVVPSFLGVDGYCTEFYQLTFPELVGD